MTGEADELHCPVFYMLCTAATLVSLKLFSHTSSPVSVRESLLLVADELQQSQESIKKSVRCRFQGFTARLVLV